MSDNVTIIILNISTLVTAFNIFSTGELLAELFPVFVTLFSLTQSFTRASLVSFDWVLHGTIPGWFGLFKLLWIETGSGQCVLQLAFWQPLSCYFGVALAGIAVDQVVIGNTVPTMVISDTLRKYDHSEKLEIDNLPMHHHVD